MSIFLKEKHVDSRYTYLERFGEIMWKSFWTPAKYKKNIEKIDIPYLEKNMDDISKECVKRTILASSLVEDKVKTFWSFLVVDIPQTVIGEVGAIFGNSEVVHAQSYRFLVEKMGLTELFEKLSDIPVMKGRIDYLNKHLTKSNISKEKQVLKKLTLFTALVERISLFSQFYIIMSFDKNSKGLKTLYSLQSSTAREECYVDGTEILTPSGWKDILSINIGDDVYQWNGGALEATKATNVVKRPHKGKVISFSKKKHQCIVTPNHNMVSFYEDGRIINELASEYTTGNSGKYLADSFTSYKNDGMMLSYMDRLKIAIQADGSRLYWVNINGERKLRGIDGGHNYAIQITKQRKKDRLDWILSNLDISYSYTFGGGYHKYRFSLPDEDYKNFDWVDVKNIDRSWAKDFCNELSEWDGFKMEGTLCTIAYSSTNRSCIDTAQHIGIIAGYRTTISRKIDNRKESYKDCYKLNFSESTGFKRSHSIKKEEMDYDGLVGCVTVPSGIIMTRYKDQTYISGNCHHYDFGLELINIIKKENPDLWDEDLKSFVTDAVNKAYVAEINLIDWIFELGYPSHLNKSEVVNFVHSNFNTVCADLKIDLRWDVDQVMYQEKNSWMMNAIMPNEPDFFANPVGGYSSVEEDVSDEDLDDIFNN